jgi:peroxiredoxin Q/BCP
MKKELKAGDKAPAFSLESSDGGKVSLKSLLGQRFVLYFYPKDMTPGCTQQACDFTAQQASFKKKRALIFGVSKDSIETHGKFIAKHKLGFPLLSDPDGKTCEAYGVWREKSLYGKKFMGIVRSTFVIGADGKIEKVYCPVRVPGHVESVLGELSASKGKIK